MSVPWRNREYQLAALPADVRSQIELALRICLASVFLVSAAAKLRAPQAFARSVANYGLLPRGSARAVGLLLLPVELLLAAALATGWLGHLSELSAGLLLAMFGGAVSVNLVRGRAIRCGCFGTDEVISIRTLARLGLLGAGVALLAAVPTSGALAWEHAVTDVGLLSASLSLAAGLVAFSIWVLHAPDVVAVLGRVRIARDSR